MGGSQSYSVRRVCLADMVSTNCLAGDVQLPTSPLHGGFNSCVALKHRSVEDDSCGIGGCTNPASIGCISSTIFDGSTPAPAYCVAADGFSCSINLLSCGDTCSIPIETVQPVRGPDVSSQPTHGPRTHTRS